MKILKQSEEITTNELRVGEFGVITEGLYTGDIVIKHADTKGKVEIISIGVKGVNNFSRYWPGNVCLKINLLLKGTKLEI